MNAPKTDNNRFSRRNFLKVTTGGIAGVLLVGATTKDASAATQSPEIELKNSSERESENYLFRDSVGRDVPLPKKIERVIPSGIYAQAVLCTLCPEKIAAVTAEIEETKKEQYRRSGRDRLCELPVTGGMYSCYKRDIKISKIAVIDSDIVLDIGCKKNDLKFSLDYLQMNTDTPAIFIDASFGKLPEAYRTLGKLLDCNSRAECLASYIENLYADINNKRIDVDAVPNVLYAKNELGLTNHKGYSFQNKAIEFIGGTPVTVPNNSLSREMDVNSLQNQSIDYVIFNNRSCFDSILNAEGRAFDIWSSVPAIQQGNYAVAPALFHSWFNSPLLVQVIGLPWLGKFIWPSAYDYIMIKMAQEFYDLFFEYALSNDEALQLLGY